MFRVPAASAGIETAGDRANDLNACISKMRGWCGSIRRDRLVEITGEAIIVAKTGVSAPPTKHATGAAFTQWAQQLDKNRDYFVLLVKPDGIANYELVRASIKQMGFDVGFDLLNSDQNAIDPERGAAAE